MSDSNRFTLLLKADSILYEAKQSLSVAGQKDGTACIELVRQSLARAMEEIQNDCYDGLRPPARQKS